MKFLSFSDTACVPEKAGVQCRRNERQIGMEVLDDETKILESVKKTMAASTLAGAITFTGCAVMPSVTAFADTTEQTGQVSYDNEVMPIHTDVKTEAKPLMKGTSCTVSDGKNLYYAFE